MMPINITRAMQTAALDRTWHSCAATKSMRHQRGMHLFRKLANGLRGAERGDTALLISRATTTTAVV